LLACVLGLIGVFDCESLKGIITPIDGAKHRAASLAEYANAFAFLFDQLGIHHPSERSEPRSDRVTRVAGSHLPKQVPS
jgi:hypothetical protein